MPSFLSTAYTPHDGCTIKEVKIQKSGGDIAHTGGRERIINTFREGSETSEYILLVTFDQQTKFGSGFENIEKFDESEPCKDKTVYVEINEVLLRPYNYRKSPMGWKLFTIWKNFVELGTPVAHAGHTTYRIPITIKHNAPELPNIPEEGIVLRVELRFFVSNDPLASSVYMIYRQTRNKPAGCSHSASVETVIDNDEKSQSYGQFLHHHKFNDRESTSIRQFARFNHTHFDISRVQRYPVPPLENHILSSNIGLSDESIVAAGTNLQILQQRIRKEVILIIIGNGYEMDKFSQYANDISVVHMTPNRGRNDQITQAIVARENNFVHKFILINEKTKLFSKILYFDMKNGKPLETKDMLRAYGIVQKKAREFSESSNVIVISTTNFEFNVQNQSLNRLFNKDCKNILYMAYSGDTNREMQHNQDFIYPAIMPSVVTVGSMLNINNVSSNFGPAVDMFCKAKTSIDALSYMLVIYGIFWKLDNEKTADEIKNMVQQYLENMICNTTNAPIRVFQNADYHLAEQFPSIFTQPHNNGIIIEEEEEEDDDYSGIEYSPNTTAIDEEGNGMIVEEFNDEGQGVVVESNNSTANFDDLQNLKQTLQVPLLMDFLQKFDQPSILNKYLSEYMENNEQIEPFSSKLVAGDVIRMFILGVAGSGKSTFARQLVKNMIDHQLQHQPKKYIIPFFTSLSGIGAVDDPIPYLEAQLNSKRWTNAQSKLLVVDDMDHSPMFNYHVKLIQAYCHDNNIKLIMCSNRKIADRSLRNLFHVFVVKPENPKTYYQHIIKSYDKLHQYNLEKLRMDFELLTGNVMTFRFLLQALGMKETNFKGKLLGKMRTIFASNHKLFSYDKFEEMMLSCLKSMNCEFSNLAIVILPYIAHWSLIEHTSFTPDILDKFEMNHDKFQKLKMDFSKILFFKRIEHYQGEEARYTFAHPIFTEFWAARHLIELAKAVPLSPDGYVKTDSENMKLFYKHILEATAQPRYHQIFEYIIKEEKFPPAVLKYLEVQLPIPFAKFKSNNLPSYQDWIRIEKSTSPQSFHAPKDNELVQLISQKVTLLDNLLATYKDPWDPKLMAKLSPELIPRKTEDQLIRGGETDHLVYLKACLKQLVENYKPYLTRNAVTQLVNNLLIRVKDDTNLRDLFVDNVPSLATICHAGTKSKIIGYLKTHILSYHHTLLNGVFEDANRVPKVVEQLVNLNGLNNFIEFCNNIFNNDNNDDELRMCSIAMLNLILFAKEQGTDDSFALQSIPACEKNNVKSLLHSLQLVNKEKFSNEEGHLYRAMINVVMAYFGDYEDVNIAFLIQELQLLTTVYQQWVDTKNPSPHLSRCTQLMQAQLVRLVSYISRNPQLNINNINTLLELVPKLETGITTHAIPYVIDYRLQFFLQYIENENHHTEKVGRMIDSAQHHAIIADLFQFIQSLKNSQMIPSFQAIATSNTALIKLILSQAKPSHEVMSKYGVQYIQWACSLLNGLSNGEEFCNYFTETLVPFLSVKYDNVQSTEYIKAMVRLLSDRPLHEQQSMLKHLMRLQPIVDASYHKIYDKTYQTFLHLVHAEYQSKLHRDYRY